MYDKDKKKSKSFLIVLVGLLLLLNIVLGYKLWKGSQEAEKLETEIVGVTDARDQLAELLDATNEELDKYKSDNDLLNTQVSGQREKLEAQAEEIKALLNKKGITQRELSAAYRKIKGLEKEVARMTAQNDSLVIAHNILLEEHVKVKETLELTEDENVQLTQEKEYYQEKVEIGARLKARNISITPIKFRRSGKEVETGRASKAEALKITFRVEDNAIATAGKKNIYIKIIDPSLTTMVEKSSTSGLFTHDGKTSVYTVMKVVDYNLKAQMVDVVWKKGSEFVKGNYSIELYSDEVMIGGGKFSLK
jgi:myosin heavy subunit